MTSKTFYIAGIHCAACPKNIAKAIESVAGVNNVNVSADGVARISGSDFSNNAIRRAVKDAGYQIVPKPNSSIVSHDSKVYITLLISVGVIALVYIIMRLTKFEFKPADISSNTTEALIIGLTAGFSTCMALIGGLVLGASAEYSQTHANLSSKQKFIKQLLFNSGRVVGFVIFGAILGKIGETFMLSPVVTAIFTVIVSVVMVLMGLQLTDVFPKIRPLSLPSKFNLDNFSAGPLILGALTFFLPCGFTQSMQLLAVSTGSSVQGALIMGLFAVGTIPGLLSMGAMTSFLRGKSGKFTFRFIGVLIIAFSLSTFSNSFNVLKALIPQKTSSNVSVSSTSSATQTLNLIYADGMFDKDTLNASPSQSYNLVIDAKTTGTGCMSAVMLPGLSTEQAQLLTAGSTITIPFTAPSSAGEYYLQCAMGVKFNTKIVVG